MNKTWCHEGQKDCYLTGMGWACGCQECYSDLRPILVKIRILKQLQTELRALGRQLKVARASATNALESV